MIVIASKPGQLGNRLFVFANFLACAIEHQLKVANPAFDEYAEYFEMTRRDFFCRYPAQISRFKGGRRTRNLFYYLNYYIARLLVRGRINNRFLRAIELDWDDEEVRVNGPQFLELASGTKMLFVQGWQYRDRTNFAKHADALRAFFRPLQPYQYNIDALIKKARSNCDVLVGVHIRHGDYKRFLDGKYFYEVDDYLRVMERVAGLHAGKSVGFLICSNAVLEASTFSGFNVTFGNDHVIEDMYSFARCDYLLGPPSTYTMWASFYGQVPLYMIEDLKREPEFDHTQSFITATQ